MNRRRIFWIVLLVALGVVLLCYRWRENSQDRVILSAARRYRVDPALIKAVVWRESWFNPRARGRAGEIGLMQIMPGTAAEWAAAEHLAGFTPEMLADPATNTLAGTWYLRKLLGRYLHTDNPAAFALADYNAGRANVLKWIHGPAATNSALFVDQIGFPGTRKYVRSILNRVPRYRPLSLQTANSAPPAP